MEHEGAPIEQQVEFNTDFFEIQFLSDDPHGFEVRTRNSLMRHTPNTPLPFAKEIARERAREGRRFRVGEAFSAKVGIRNPHLEGDELVVDTMPVTFPTYKALSEPTMSSEQRDISNPTGTALILLTTEDDGTHKFILQHRSPKNFFYGDIPGASVAGMFDGKLEGAVLAPVDTTSIKANGEKEMKEEIGLYPRDIEDVRITGFAADKVRVHQEFLLLTKTKLSSEDIRFRSGLGDHFRFIEQAITINATIDAVEKLLTEVKCPLPPTHIAAFVAAGYSMVLEEQGKDAANAWKKKMEEGVNKNYREIDERVRTFYESHPQELENIPDGKPRRNPRGYEPAYTPSQQGLPDMESELDRVGLKIKELGEYEKTIDEVSIFDVDGVITHPQEKRADHDVLEAIAKRLKKGEPVILNTGRSISWLQQEVIARLYYAHSLTDKSAMQNLFLIGEKGGAWMGFDEEGMMDPVPHKDGSISVPKGIQDRIRQLVKDEFSDTMFYDESKVTMVSVEESLRSPNETDEEHQAKFEEAQRRLVQRLNDIVSEEHLEDFKVDPTTIATDLESKQVGKDFGIQRALAWLKQRGLKVNNFVTFGDSKSDFAMANQLHNEGYNVKHIHVGKDEDIPAETAYEIIRTIGKYNRGAAEYLQNR